MNSNCRDIDIGLFPIDYSDARRRWRAAALPVAATLGQYSCQGFGPNGESLFSDWAWIGPTDAASVLILLAATHGVEGFVGSAVQLDFLNNFGQQTPVDDTATLLIHGLTPWGYAWSRRCDADGVDLNRNCIDFTNAPNNPHYDQLRSALFESDSTIRRRLFDDFAARHGRVAFEQAISGGQYRDPAGPFFGGFAPAHGRKVCEQLIAEHRLKSRRLAVIDLHSGLGPYGYGEIICDHPPDSPGAAVARQWYGDAVTLPLAGTSHSVPKLGLLDYLWHAIMNDDSCFVTLEFGSYPTEQLFEVLLQDHQLWAQTGNEAVRQQHSDSMRKHFCPVDPAWRELVLFRARQVVAQARQGLNR